jgi:hypothetical protein
MTMMRLTRGTTRDPVTKPHNHHLPDGIGGTITGGAMELLDLPEMLERGAHEAGRGGAVAGAAQVAADGTVNSSQPERGIALSDGSRICFASIVDTGLFRDRDAATASDATMNNVVRAPGMHRARLLASV